MKHPLLCAVLVLALQAAARTEEDVQTLVEQLNSPDLAAAFAARQHLESHGKTAVPHLLAVMEDHSKPSPWRRVAAEVLGKVGDETVLPSLERLLAEDLEEETDEYLVRMGALEGISGIGGDAALAVLRRTAREHPDVDVRGTAIRLLEDHVEQADLRDDLLAAMRDAEPFVRSQAGRAMSGVERWEERHFESLRDLVRGEAEEDVRVCLAKAIRNCDTAGTQEELERLLTEDPSAEVRMWVAGGLADRGGEHILALFERCLATESESGPRQIMERALSTSDRHPTPTPASHPGSPRPHPGETVQPSATESPSQPSAIAIPPESGPQRPSGQRTTPNEHATSPEEDASTPPWGTLLGLAATAGVGFWILTRARRNR